MATPDITVMGAGIFGLSIAYACAKQGARVAIIDPAGPGAGSSGGVVGALAPHTPERWEPKKDFQLESLMQAEEFWKEVDVRSGLSSGYGRTGRLQPIHDDHGLGLAQERVEQARTLWRGFANWSVCPAQDFDAWVPTSATGLVVYDTLSARMDPARACKSLVAALETYGVAVQNQGECADVVIWATGYQGLLDLSRERGREVGNGVKGQSVLLAYDQPDSPQIFSDGIYFVPHDNATLAIGSTSERYFEDPSATDDLLDQLYARALAAMPQLAEAPVLARWAGVRPRARTRAPMLGHYPGKPGQFIVNGGFKIGFGMAPKIADLMADLVLNGVDRIPAEFLVEASL